MWQQCFKTFGEGACICTHSMDPVADRTRRDWRRITCSASSIHCWYMSTLYLLLMHVLRNTLAGCWFQLEGGKLVKNHHIKLKEVLWYLVATPDSISWHIQPCTILAIGWGPVELVGCNWLQFWFDAYTWEMIDSRKKGRGVTPWLTGVL